MRKTLSSNAREHLACGDFAIKINYKRSIFSLNKTRPLKWLKSSQNKKDLNDVTVSRCFFAAGSWEKDNENGAAVTSLRSFLLSNDFSIHTFCMNKSHESLYLCRFKQTIEKCLFFRHSVNCGHEKERILEVGKTLVFGLSTAALKRSLRRHEENASQGTYIAFLGDIFCSTPISTWTFLTSSKLSSL